MRLERQEPPVEIVKDSGSLPSGKRNNRPNKRNGYKRGGGIYNDAPAFACKCLLYS